MKKYLLFAVLTLCFALPVFADGNNGSTDAQATNITNAGGICKGARAQYDTQLRYRPLSLVNESGASSFVNCFFTVWEEAADQHGGVERFGVVLRNQSPVTALVKCLSIVGVDNGSAQYETKNVTLLPNERKRLEFTRGGAGFQGPIGLQCLLPPYVGINETFAHWDYNDAR